MLTLILQRQIYFSIWNDINQPTHEGNSMMLFSYSILTVNRKHGIISRNPFDRLCVILILAVVARGREGLVLTTSWLA